jgi:uncharacterized damage-inducible protein DinB
MPALAPPQGDERSQLLAYLTQQREAIRIATYGLSDHEIRQTPAASSLSLGGLLKHAALTERFWIDQVAGRSRNNDHEADTYADRFRLDAEESLANLLAFSDVVAAETESTIGALADLEGLVPVPPDPWFPSDVAGWSTRWVLLHLIEELARHAGHADIVRETLDGATAVPLLAAVEDWEPQPWVEPWRPSVVASSTLGSR